MKSHESADHEPDDPGWVLAMDVEPKGMDSANSSLPVGSRASRELTAEEKKQILRERAKRLAQQRESEQTDEAYIHVIEFLLAHERYAAEVAYVHEVYPLKDLTPVPCTPPFVLGIINVRGQVISVLDVRGFFDLPKREITDLFRVIIVKNHDVECGILADEVVGERRIPLDQLQRQLTGLRGIREEYIKGVTTDRSVVIDIEKLLADENVIVHQEVGD